MTTPAGSYRDYAERSRGESLELLKRLVAIESPSGYRGGVRQVAELIGGRLDRLGMGVELISSERFGAHLVASIGPAPARAVLVGHLDTVFPPGTGWSLTVEDQIVRGPGVADMKGGLVALVAALETLAAFDSLTIPVQVILVGDEEVGSPESTAIIEERTRGVEWGLVFEPGPPGGGLINQRKGFAHFSLSVEGRAAHAGQDPRGGIDANRELIAQCGTLYQLADTSAGTTVNVGRIDGGQAPAIISASARAEIDVRVETASEQRRLETGVLASVQNPANPSAKVRVEGGFTRAPMLALPRTPQLMGIATQAGRACGQDVTFQSDGAVSDANTLVSNGIPSLDGLGPVGGRIHSHDEWAALNSLVDRIALTATILSTLPACSQAADEQNQALAHGGER